MCSSDLFLTADPGLNLRFLYSGRPGNLSIPMKYVEADTAHTNILPYNFYYMPSNQTWGVTYADVHKLYIASSSRYLEERVDGLLEYRFRLSMHEDLSRFSISASPSSSWYGFRSELATLPTRFIGYDDSVEYFFVTPFVK